MKAGMFGQRSPISVSIFSAASLAPPCAGTPQAGNAGGDTGERVCARRASETDRRCRGVLLMVSVQDEDLVDARGPEPGSTLYSSHGTAKHMCMKFDGIVESSFFG
jgi:hypothetical protein